MADEVTISPQPDPSFALENKRMDLEAGWLGRVFGTGSAAPTSIAGLVIVLLTAAGIALLFFETKMRPAEYWPIAAPIITLAMGYLFGKRE